MNLTELFSDYDVNLERDPEVSGISSDTRDLEEGDLFIALPGHDTDGHHFIDDAIQKGASAVVAEENRLNRDYNEIQVPVILLPDTRALLPELLTQFYGKPSKDLSIIGITGTNGKTTTTYLIHSILETEGESIGLIGTIERCFEGDVREGQCTTPSLVENFRCLQEWNDMGATAAVMEASSHGLDQGRVREISFTAAAFTNLSQDHLDYHGSMDSYFEAKKQLFERAEFGVAYVDDPYAQKLIESPTIKGVGEGDFEYTVEDPKIGLEGIEVTLITPDDKTMELESPLTGLFNYKNMALAAALAYELGIDGDVIRKGLQSIQSVPGRCERISGPPDVVVDYAHTPDAMKSVLESLKPLVEGDLICVFGAGGDRDRSKRPKMGNIAGEIADYSVVTSDNPRSEEPSQIIDDILTGMKSFTEYHVQEDRGQAIRDAIEGAEEDDLIVIVGKGHETEQVIGDQVIPFEDKSVAEDVLKYQNK